ncbi:MAG: TIR domain-containing protein [Proteobacteria bacterium]|nr:TIR domain-containing protein [Pseudomonadota bacterium]
MDDQARPDPAPTASSDAPAGARYRAFISYSHRDETIARRLHRMLERYRLPSRLRGTQGEFGTLPDSLAPIFRDREDLASAGELGPRIRAALAASDALIVVCSPAAAASPWVDGEVLEFKRRGNAHRIYALIVDGEPGDAARECFPPALRHELDAQGQLGQRPAEPLAADLRPGHGGWSLARLKLLSGLLGVSLDTLRQREHARRHRRMLAITALALGVTLVTSILAVQAVIQRDAALRRQKQAETLVDFMLGDLNDKLNQVSRLDILEAVDDHAMAYFQSLPVTDVTEQTLEQRARAYERIGNVRQAQGHLPQALEAFQAAAVITDRLARSQPSNIGRQLANANSLTYIGTMHWYQGDLAGAQRGFEAGQAVLDRARALDPKNPQLLYQLAGIVNNIGHVLEARGEFAKARKHYRDLLSISLSLVAMDAKSTAWNVLLGLAHNNLAKMALLDGDLTTAINEYRADFAIETMLAERDPRDNAQAEKPLLAQAALGRTLALAGDLDGGIAQMRQALAGVERLHAVDKTDSGFSEDVALYATQLARLLRQHGKLPEASALTTQAVAMLDTLTRQDPGNANWKRERAETLVEQAMEMHASGHDDLALEPARSALATLEPMLAAQPQDRATVLATSAARLALASSSSDPIEATRLRQQTLATLQAQVSGRHDPRLQALSSEALEGLRGSAVPGDHASTVPVSTQSHRP